jgi:hypothetical protein
MNQLKERKTYFELYSYLQQSKIISSPTMNSYQIRYSSKTQNNNGKNPINHRMDLQ